MGYTSLKISADLTFLSECLSEVLVDCGESSLLPFLRYALHKENLPPTSIPFFQEKVPELFSLCFQLLNLVEENAAAQYRRSVEEERSLSSIPGLWGQTLEKCKVYGLGVSQILEMFPQVQCEAVLTAHPTEAKRRTILEIYRELYLLLVKRENGMWTKYEQSQIRIDIKQNLERLWRTGEIYLQKPDVASERRNIEYYLTHVFPEVIPILDIRLKQAWTEAGYPANVLQQPESFPKVRFGNWVGGDRDGHPFVTADVTRDTLESFAQLALQMQREKLLDLTRALSLSDRLQNPPKSLLDQIQTWKEEGKGASDHCISRNPSEPWRQYCNFLLYFLDKGISPVDYARYLRFLAESLEKCGSYRLAEQLVFPIERLFLTFGFHLVQTDIRQNSAYHSLVMEQMLKASGEKVWNYREWTEEEKISFLKKELQSPRPFLLPESPLETEAASLIQTYKVIQRHCTHYGKDGIGSFIVSMTKEVSDLLLVFLFLREVGLLRQKQDGSFFSLFQVVPLFETIEDLEKAPGLLDAYLSYPIVQNSILDQTQQVMLGYSDSNKDGGIFASQWNLYNAENKLTEVGRKYGIKIRFFHGRGGTISRGGGKTHKFLDALPHGSLSGQIRMTVQGETIAQQFANKLNAAYNLELFVATTTKVALRHKHLPKKEHPAFPIVSEVARATAEVYTKLLEAKGFIEFYSQATPIDAIEQSKIGSRPSRRTGKRSFQDLRAIPWVFSWNQSRFYLPNWFGVGSALQQLKSRSNEEFQIFKKEIGEWHFLNYLIRNIETGLFSANPEIFRKYGELVKEKEIRNFFLEEIQKEYDVTKQMLSELRDIPLEQARPGMVETIRLRQNGLEILHDLQVKLLREWREKPESPKLLNELLLTINAIAGGLRTTG